MQKPDYLPYTHRSQVTEVEAKEIVHYLELGGDLSDISAHDISAEEKRWIQRRVGALAGGYHRTYAPVHGRNASNLL